MKITIYFMKSGEGYEYPVERINQIDAGITILDEGSASSGTFYPWHVIHRVRVDD